MPDGFDAPSCAKQGAAGTKARTYCGMTSFMDAAMGNLTAALRRTGLWNNTLLLFTADNGGWLDMGGSNAPLQGGKFSDLEGGTRATAFVAGGLLPAARRGATERGYVAACDWYATFLRLAGLTDAQIVDRRAAAAGLPPLDSLDVWPLLSGANGTSPRVEIPLSANPPPGNYSGSSSSGFRAGSRGGGFLAVDAGEAGLGYYVGGEALISGPWKLVTGIQHSGAHDDANFTVCGDGVGPDPVSNASNPGGCLFHIMDDPTEAHDQAAAQPAVMNRLLKRQHEIRAGVFAPHRGLLEPGACVANNASGGFWAPWLPAPPGWPTFL